MGFDSSSSLWRNKMSHWFSFNAHTRELLVGTAVVGEATAVDQRRSIHIITQVPARPGSASRQERLDRH